METTDVGVLSPAKLYLHLYPALRSSLAEAVASALEGDEEKARWLIEFGAVYVDQLRCTLVQRQVEPKNLIRIHLKPKRYAVDCLSLRRRVVHENDDFMIIDKPSGLPMHPTLDNLHENLISSFGIPLHVTHRLDVPTSGLVLVAKTKEYQALFNKTVAARRVEKTYQTLTSKPVPVGLHRHFMRKSVRAPKEVIGTIAAGEEPSTFEVCELVVEDCHLDAVSDFFLSTVTLLTGRTHQIRAQFKFLGAPLLGDEMYGGKPYHRFGLHASGLRFECPKYGMLLSFNSDMA